MNIDPDFAWRLRAKAEYWTDPPTWRGKPGLDISIESVATAARYLLPRATRNVPDVRPVPKAGSDIFVSHASEDKETVAKPLADALGRFGYLVWIDHYVLQVGDSLRRAIDAALGTCRYGVVILSPSFFEKEWTQIELDGLVAMEAQDRRKRILPVLHRLTVGEVSRHSPTLADRLAVSTDLGMDVVVSMIVDVLKRDIEKTSAPSGSGA